MNARNTETAFTAEWTVSLEVPGKIVRPCPYSSGDYQVDRLSVVFRLIRQANLRDCTLPQLTEDAAQGVIEIHSIDAHGYRLKKDGTPGTQPKSEHFYSYRERPKWADELIDPLLTELMAA